jgi:hypothetical protein
LEFSLLSYSIIGNSGFPSGIFPHSGSWLARLAGDDDGISWVEQQVDISSYAGQTVMIRIRADTDESNCSSR